MVYNIASQMNMSISQSKFVVDTNVLYWMFYGNCTYSNEKRQKLYPDALINLKLKNNILYTPATCLFELFSIIEKNEYRLYCAREGISEEDFKLKDYRKLAEERARVAREIEITYKSIKSFLKITEQTITKEQLANLAEEFGSHVLDVYDRILVDYCVANGIQNIVTDDQDYMSANKQLNIYTANENYFKSSEKQQR